MYALLMLRTTCRASGAATIALMLVLGVMAYASAADVRDFEDIAASDVVVTPDPSGLAAILEVDTSIDVACSVVYGTDESFGLIAVDSDMDGGAHADHHPVMGGLEPETTYLYRLQGTAPDGTLYVSEVMSFDTPAAAEGPDNLALGATITGVSSEWSDAFTAENAFDGDPTTEWSTASDGDDAWVEIDLGASQAIGDVIFRTRDRSRRTNRSGSCRTRASTPNCCASTSKTPQAAIPALSRSSCSLRTTAKARPRASRARRATHARSELRPSDRLVE